MDTTRTSTDTTRTSTDKTSTGTVISRQFMRFVIDRVMTFESLLKSNYSLISRFSITSSGTCFCPFHDNVNTRSAKLYKDNEGERIYCFAESKMFRPHDLLERGIVEIQLENLFASIWRALDNDAKQRLETLYGKGISTYNPKDFSSLHTEYRNGTITLNDVVYGMLDWDNFPYKKKTMDKE